MAKRKRQPPSYRQRSGYDQAIVTLPDSVTGYRIERDPEFSPFRVWLSWLNHTGS